MKTVLNSGSSPHTQCTVEYSDFCKILLPTYKNKNKNSHVVYIPKSEYYIKSKDCETKYDLKPIDFIHSPKRKHLKSRLKTPNSYYLFEKLNNTNATSITLVTPSFECDLTKLVFCYNKKMYFISNKFLFYTKDPIEFADFVFKYFKTSNKTSKNWWLQPYFSSKNHIYDDYENISEISEEWKYANEDDEDKIIIPADSFATHFSLYSVWEYMETFYTHLLACLIEEVKK